MSSVNREAREPSCDGNDLPTPSFPALPTRSALICLAKAGGMADPADAGTSPIARPSFPLPALPTLPELIPLENGGRVGDVRPRSV